MINVKGFTLVELLIAAAVVVIALLGYVGTTTVIQQSSEGFYEKSVAMQDANRVLEQIRNSAKSGQFPGNVTASFPNNGNVAGFANLTNENVTVSYVNTTSDPLDVTVTVGYVESRNRNRTVAVRSLITQR